MSSIQNFEEAQGRAKQLPPQSNEILLELYSLYKQATTGDVSGKKPGMLDIKARAKYEAWAKKKGISKEKAMESYIQLVDQLSAKK